MAEKYKVTLSDGRTVLVTTEGGAPSEADIMGYLGSGGATKAPVGEIPGSTPRLRAVTNATEPSLFLPTPRKSLTSQTNQV